MITEISEEKAENPVFDLALAKKDKDIMAVEEGLQFILAEAADLQIVDQETREAASAIRSQVKDLEKKLKAREEFFKRPAQDYVKAVGSFFKFFNEKLSGADDILKQKQLDDYNDQVKKLKEAQAKIDAEAEEKRKIAEAEAAKTGAIPELEMPTVIVQPADTMVRTMEGGTAFAKRWTFSVEIADQVPREYCEPVDKLIREAVKNGQRNIAGVKIFEETYTVRK